MSMTAYLAFGANALLLVAAALVLWRRSRPLLALLLVIAVAAHFAGLIYVINSPEHPDASGNYSALHTVFDAMANLGYLAQSGLVLAICLAIAPPQPNPSFNGRRGTFS